MATKEPSLEQKILANLNLPDSYTHQESGNKTKISGEMKEAYAGIIKIVSEESEKVAAKYANLQAPESNDVKDLDSLLKWVREFSEKAEHFGKLHEIKDDSNLYNMLLDIVSTYANPGKQTDAKRLINELLAGDKSKIAIIKQAFQNHETYFAGVGKVKYHLQKQVNTKEKELQYAAIVAHIKNVASGGLVSHDHYVIRQNLDQEVTQAILEQVNESRGATYTDRTAYKPHPTE